MPPTNREELLKEAFFRLDIPQFIFPYLRKAGQVIGPYDPEFFRRCQEQREEQEAEAIAALEAMSDLELLHLFSDDGDWKEFARDHGLYEPPPWYAGGFALRAIEDFNDWCKYEYWTLHEVTCLSMGFSPEDLPDPPKLARYAPPHPPLGSVDNQREAINVAARFQQAA